MNAILAVARAEVCSIGAATGAKAMALEETRDSIKNDLRTEAEEHNETAAGGAVCLFEAAPRRMRGQEVPREAQLAAEAARNKLLAHGSRRRGHAGEEAWELTKK